MRDGYEGEKQSNKLQDLNNVTKIVESGCTAEKSNKQDYGERRFILARVDPAQSICAPLSAYHDFPDASIAKLAIQRHKKIRQDKKRRQVTPLKLGLFGRMRQELDSLNVGEPFTPSPAITFPCPWAVMGKSDLGTSPQKKPNASDRSSSLLRGNF
ncbi:hypothetical protein AVEN_139453-1 [Araneus ventricosus]|uniref:Uncharacterized protein n=1 Tax=Araneus ventricosus TaxID=182803 RepID=A0A4Y2IZT3_ARAVE|nr:hypothetical protein AVEN_139453-1 [Araneus ventricosus]